MHRKIAYSHKRNLLFITIILTIIFLVMNISLYMINEYFTYHKVEEETDEFLLLTTYLINENDLQVALEYIGHYSDTHSVDVAIYSEEQDLIYSSSQRQIFSKQYSINTNKGEFLLDIDNSHSVTVELLDNNYYINVIIIVIYLIGLSTLFFWNKSTSKKIESDLSNVMTLINDERSKIRQFNYSEFNKIYNVLSSYISDLDLLKEQKQMNVRGLAHDIKTPLTIIYNYVSKTNPDEKNKDNAKSAVIKMNKLVHDLIEENYSGSFVQINLNKLLKDTIKYYQSIFNSKNIKIDYDSDFDVLVCWSERDFLRIIENLFSNAYFYSYENTTFYVYIYHLKGKKRIKFMSEGNPIKEENYNKIFEKGYRDNDTKGLNNEGKGLGLYICKLLLKPINGEITVKSDGSYNIFEIIIP